MAGEADRHPGAAVARPRSFALRALTAASVTAGVALFLLLLWHAADVLLLVFAAILLAVALRGLSEQVGRMTNLSESWSLALVSLLLLSALAGAVLLHASRRRWTNSPAACRGPSRPWSNALTATGGRAA